VQVVPAEQEGWGRIRVRATGAAGLDLGRGRGMPTVLARWESAVPSLLLVGVPTETWVVVIAVDLLVRVVHELR
jgi:hypothetical protein